MSDNKGTSDYSSRSQPCSSLYGLDFPLLSNVAVDVDGVWGEGESLVVEWDLVSILGVLIGEREGGNGVSVGMIGVVFGFCGRGIN